MLFDSEEASRGAALSPSSSICDVLDPHAQRARVQAMGGRSEHTLSKRKAAASVSSKLTRLPLERQGVDTLCRSALSWLEQISSHASSLTSRTIPLYLTTRIGLRSGSCGRAATADRLFTKDFARSHKPIIPTVSILPEPSHVQHQHAPNLSLSVASALKAPACTCCRKYAYIPPAYPPNPRILSACTAVMRSRFSRSDTLAVSCASCECR